MRVNRRQTLFGLTGLATAGWPSIGVTQTKVSLGSSDIYSVSDGHLVLPGSMFFDELPPDQVAEILARHGLSPDQLEPPCNLTLLQRADRTVLFDAGAGSGFMPTAGRTIEALAALGITADDITDVVFTHGHPDHLWGVLDDFDDPVFPNARMMFGKTEWDYWTDPNTVDSIGEARASFAVGAARRLDAISDQIELFNAGQEILPGVLAHATHGHTPGHMSFEIREGSNAVMVAGDAVVNHHVALARPEWPSGSDQDPEMGARTRLRLLDQLATDQIALLGFHLPEGGLGRIDRMGDGYRFVSDAS